MKWTVLAVLCLTCLVTVNAANDTNVNGTIAQTAVQLSNDTAFGVCLYPTSVSLTPSVINIPLANHFYRDLTHS